MTVEEALSSVTAKASEVDSTVAAMNEEKPDLASLTATLRQQSVELTAAVDELARVSRDEPGESE